jgi:hypothetical protein
MLLLRGDVQATREMAHALLGTLVTTITMQPTISPPSAGEFQRLAAVTRLFHRCCGRGARLPLPKTLRRAILRPTTAGNQGVSDLVPEM